MTQKHYVRFAEIIGAALADAHEFGGEDARTVVEESVYRPISAYLHSDNPQFDRGRFSYACAVAEGKRLNALRGI